MTPPPLPAAPRRAGRRLRRCAVVLVSALALLAGTAAPASAQFVQINNPVVQQRADTGRSTSTPTATTT